MTVYLSGSITNRPKTYKKEFAKAAEKVRKFGLPILPFHENEEPDFSDDAQVLYMIRAVKQISLCDAVYFMKGWPCSAGCRAEFALAEKFGKELLFE